MAKRNEVVFPFDFGKFRVQREIDPEARKRFEITAQSLR